MNKIAFIFYSAPHGKNYGREGLDALIATSAITDNNNIGVFFISDGILQILSGQKPSKVLARDYISTFKVLTLYEIKNIWICEKSISERGIKNNKSVFILNVTLLTPAAIRKQLSNYNTIMIF